MATTPKGRSGPATIAELNAEVAEEAWALKMDAVPPGICPVAHSLAFADELKSITLLLIGRIQTDLLKELRGKRPRISKLNALLKSAELVRRTERMFDQVCATHLKIAIELERRLQARAAGASPPAAGS